MADNDNWDPLSYVGSTDYFVMRTAPGSWVAIIDVNGNWLFSTMQLPGHASNDASLSVLGGVFVDDAESALAIHMGANGEVAGEVQISAINPVSASFDPKAICDGTFDGLALFTVGDEAPNGIIIDQWKLAFVDGDPTTEATGLNLRFADSHPTRANSVVIDVLDTTAGVSGEDTDSNINSGLYIPFGKVIYLQFTTPYTEENHQISFELWYHAEED